jgi:hypothetical protein
MMMLPHSMHVHDVQFPLEKIYEKLNGVEHLNSAENQWGGSNMVGGSPRKTGSCLARNSH